MAKNKKKISVPGFLANGISAGIKESDQKDLGFNLFNHTGESSSCIYQEYFQGRAVVY